MLVGKKPLPRAVCVPVDKQPNAASQAQDLRGDYLLYQLKCPPQPDVRSLHLDSQFVRGNFIVGRKTAVRWLLVPARKSVPVPPCQVDATGMCGGQCPDPATEKCQIRLNPATNTDECGCFPVVSTPCGFIPGTNQCGGGCPNPGEQCKTFTTATGLVTCDCVP